MTFTWIFRMMHLLACPTRSLTFTQVGRVQTRNTLENKVEGVVLAGFDLEVVSFVYWVLELHAHPSKKEPGEDHGSRGPVPAFGWCTEELLGTNIGWLEVDLGKQRTEVEPLQCLEVVTWFMAVGIKAKRNSGKMVFSSWSWVLMGFVSLEPIFETILYLCTSVPSERKHCNTPERGLISSCS